VLRGWPVLEQQRPEGIGSPRLRRGQMRGVPRMWRKLLGEEPRLAGSPIPRPFSLLFPVNSAGQVRDGFQPRPTIRAPNQLGRVRAGGGPVGRPRGGGGCFPRGPLLHAGGPDSGIEPGAGFGAKNVSSAPLTSAAATAALPLVDGASSRHLIAGIHRETEGHGRAARRRRPFPRRGGPWKEEENEANRQER